MNETITRKCHECGNEHTAGKNERAICYGSPPERPHQKVEVIYPCGICGDPITTAEMCRECAEESDVDAVTPTWGKHRYGENDE